jgi:uncharacterized protein (TIGR01370 family)
MRRYAEFLAGLVVAAYGLAFPVISYAITLKEVRSFEYVVDGGTSEAGYLQAVGAGPSDLVVIGGCSTDPPPNRHLADPRNDKILLGYMDVAEASACSTPQFFTGGSLPSWFGNQTAGYSGLYTVRYWSADWPAALHTQIDRLIADGYDGIFLDVLSADGEWSAGNPEGNPVYPNATHALATLVSQIRAYVAAKKISRPFYLAGNNPISLAQRYPSVLAKLDGIFNECLYWAQPATNGLTSVYRGTADAQWLLDNVAPIYRKSGIPVFGNDYPNPLTDLTADFQSFAYYAALGWVPSVQRAAQTDEIYSTGPFMAMAVAGNTTIVGASSFVNFLSGGIQPSATLIGGNKMNYFIGGPGKNTIHGGAGANLIYAHPASAALKNTLELQFVTGALNATKTPAVTILINGKPAVRDLHITQNYNNANYHNQTVTLDVARYGPISSLEVKGLNIYYIDSSHFNNVFIELLSYEGQSISFNLGKYSPYSESLDNGAQALLNANGTVTFPASAFKIESPFLPDTSDTIDGGATGTVVYRGPAANYTVTAHGDGAYVVRSAGTAEGPDTMVNVQKLRFTDKTIDLP